MRGLPNKRIKIEQYDDWDAIPFGADIAESFYS